MPWNGNVTGSSVASIPQAHGPKEMDRVNRYFSDVDLEALAGDGSVATIRTKTRFRSNKLQFISDDGHIINIIIPVITNDKNVTLPNDSGTLSLGGGGTPISVINNLGVGGVGVFKNAAAGEANFYSLASISPAIDIALDAGNNLIEISLDETVINLSNLAGTLPISKGGTGQTTKVNAFDALAPTTTAGDMIYRNASGDNVRLPIGSNGYVLGVSGGIPTWIPAPAGGGGGGGGTDITLFRNTTVVDVVSTAAETNLFSFTIPANTMGTTGLVRIIVTGSYINNSGSDDKYALRLKLGGVTIWSDESGTQSTGSNRRPVFIQLFIKNNNSASSQKVGGTFINGNDVLGDVGISDISSDEIRGQSPIVASASINTAADAVLALSVDHDDSSSNISFQADIISVELIGGTGGGGTGDITGAANVGSGAGLVFRDEVAGVLNFKRFIAGTNITITNGADDITIAASGGGAGEANTASNVGSGTGTIFKQKTGVDLELKTLLAGSNITLTNNASDITIAASGGGATPGGASGDVQYNNGASAFGGEAAFNYDFTNDRLVVPGLKVNNEFFLNGEITPTQLAANTNDYNPTGFATAVRVRLSTDASRDLTGLVPPASPDGLVKIITNVGSNNLVLKNESASSTAANRFTLGADLTLTAGKTAILLYDSNTSRWILLATSVDLNTGGGGAATELDVIEQARQRVAWIEDFFSLVDKPNWIPLVTGTAAAVNGFTVGAEDAFGIAEVNSGTTTTGESAIVFGHSATVKPVRLGKGILTIEFRIKFPTLSTSTQEYKAEVGLVDDPQSSGANNRVWMEYDRTSALFWTMITSSGGTNSTLDTSSTVGTGWTRIKIEVNAAASLVTFYVDGVSVGTRTANIPTGVDLFPAVTMFKTAGTTARTILVDYVAFDYNLTTPR
jgi:hypothetical protein